MSDFPDDDFARAVADVAREMDARRTWRERYAEWRLAGRFLLDLIRAKVGR